MGATFNIKRMSYDEIKERKQEPEQAAESGGAVFNIRPAGANISQRTEPQRGQQIGTEVAGAGTNAALMAAAMKLQQDTAFEQSRGSGAVGAGTAGARLYGDRDFREGQTFVQRRDLKTQLDAAGEAYEAARRRVGDFSRGGVSREQRDRAQEELAAAKAERNRLQREYEAVGGAPDGFIRRAMYTMKGGAKQSLGSNADAMGFAYQTGQSTRDDMNDSVVSTAKRAYEDSLWELNDMIASGTRTEEQIRRQREIVEADRKRYEALAGIDDAQRGAGEAARELAALISRSGAQDIDTAKRGMGTFGGMLVDAGASMTQSAIDIGVGKLLGVVPGKKEQNLIHQMQQSGALNKLDVTGIKLGQMLPFGARAFGGGTMEARADGADLRQQMLYGGGMTAIETASEFLSDIVQPFAAVMGSGVTDDVVEKAVRNVTNRLAKSEAGRQVLGRLMTYASGGIGEGIEEAIADWAEWQLPRIYGGDVDSAGQVLENSLYDFAVGTLSGLGDSRVLLNRFDSGETSAERGNFQNMSVFEGVLENKDAGQDMLDRKGKQILSEADRASFGKEGQQIIDVVMERSMLQGMRREQAFGAFSRAYHQGMTGQKMTAVDGLTEDGIRMAYRAGKNDAAASLAREKQEAQFASVAGEDAGLVMDDYVKETMGAGEYDVLNETAKRLGLRVQFVDELAHGANADINGAEVRIQKDNPNPVRFLLGHEITHRLQELAPEDYRKFRDLVMQGESGRVLAYQYIYREGGVTLDYEAAMDEAAADYAGRLMSDGQLLERFIAENRENRTLLERLRDAFRALVDKLTGRERAQAQTAEQALTRALNEAEKQAKKNAGENKTAAQEGDGARYSIEYDSDNTPFVVVERDILAGVPESDWVRTVKENLRQKFPNGVTVGNSKIEIDKDSRREMTWSGYSRWLKRTNPSIYADKLRATDHADEILLASRDYVNEAPKHGRKDSIREFARGTVQLRIGQQDYSAEVIVGIRADGSMMLYDLLNLQGMKIKERSQARRTENPSPSAGRSTLQGSSADSIPEAGGKSKSRFSLTDSEGRQLTDAQAEFFKDSKVRDDEGRLLPVYHGTDADFTVFDVSEIREREGSFFFAQNREDAEGYSGQGKVMEVYVNLQNPIDYNDMPLEIDQLKTKREQVEALKKLGYDGWMCDMDTGWGEISAFYPEQIKRVDNLSPTDDPDIRFSMTGAREFAERVLEIQKDREGKTDAEVRKEIIRLTEEFREQLMQAEEQTLTDRASVRRAGRKLIKEFGADMKPGEIADDLQTLYDYMAGGEKGDGNIAYGRAREQAVAVARKLVSSATVTDDTLYREFEDLRGYLRSQKIVVPEEAVREIGDFDAYRKSTMGKLVLGTKGHANLDMVYSELCEMYPAWFDGEALAGADQLDQIVNAAEAIYNRPEYNPFDGGDMEQVVQAAASEIMEMFYDLPQAKNRQSQRMSERDRAALRREVSEQLNRRREYKERQIEELKEKHAERMEQLAARNLRQRIARKANQMGQALLKPTDKKHVPEPFRGAVLNLVLAINLESGYELEYGRDAKYNRVKPGESLYSETTKRTENFMQLREQYRQMLRELEKANADCMCELDGELVDSINEVLKGQDKRIVDMSREELDTVWKTLQALDRAMQNYGRTLSEAKYARTEEWATALANSTRKDRRRPVNRTIDLETPYTFFDSLGEAGKEIFNILRKARDKRTQMIQEVREKAAEIVTPEQAKRFEETRHEFTTERGDELTLTTAGVMEVYALSRRKQAHDHLMEGGIHQPEIGRGKDKIDRGTDSIMLSMKDLQNIVSVLSKEEAEIAVKMQTLASTVLAKYGNDASMEVYGYKKFNERYYWPIVTSQEGKHTNAEKGANQPRNIRNIGMGKQTVQGANTPMEINGMFRTFAKHTSDMINYATLLAPMADCERLYNFRFRDEDGNKTGKSVKSVLQQKAGKEAIDYWNNLMDDLQNGIEPKRDTVSERVASKLYGGFKAAAVSGNIRVIIQQPTAFFRAAAVLDPADLAAGFKGGVATENGADGKPMSAWDKAKKHAPIAMQKDMGGFDIGSQRSLYDMMFGNPSILDRGKEWTTAGAAKADALTWGRLWNACEHAVKRERTDLEIGSTAFFDAVSEKFTDMIDQTQVVDGVLQRSQSMRSSNAVTQQANAFMGEPTQSLNLFLRTWNAWRFEQDTNKRSQAQKVMGRALRALVVTELINAVAQSLVDAIRADDPDKDYWEKFMTAFTGVEGDEDSPWDYFYNIAFNGNLGSNLNPLNKLPYVKDISSLAKGYSVSRGEMEVISDIVSGAKMAITSIGGNGARTRIYAINELLRSAAKVTGLPVQNLERDTWAVLRLFAVETDNIPLQYEMEKAIYNLSSSKSTGRFLDVMFRALEQEDYDTYEHIRNDLMNAGVTDGKKIDSGMRSRLAKRQKEDPYYALPERAADLIAWRPALTEKTDDDKFDEGNLNAAQYSKFAEERAELYRGYTSQLDSNRYFAELDDETREKVYDMAERLAQSKALENHAGGLYEMDTGWMLWATGGAAAGVDETEAILFKAAYDLASGRDESGKTVTGLKKERTLETAERLMPWLTEQELDYLKSQYWK